MLTVGSAFTVTVRLAVFWQPVAAVPVTVYVPLLLTVIAAVVCPPGLHRYVFAPLAVSVTLPPAQNVVGPPGVILTVGSAFTVTVRLAVFWQPVAAVPVTVYVPLLLTVIAAVV